MMYDDDDRWQPRARRAAERELWPWWVFVLIGVAGFLTWCVLLPWALGL